MSETWDDYTSADSGSESSDLTDSWEQNEATFDASVQAFDNVITGTGDVSTDLDNVASNDDWASWDSASARDWQNSADSYESAGVDALNSGDYESAQTDFADAQSYAEGASNYADTASDYADTADSWAQQASDDAAYNES